MPHNQGVLTKTISIRPDWLSNLERFLNEATTKTRALSFTEAHGLVAATVTDPQPPPLPVIAALVLADAHDHYDVAAIEDAFGAILALQGKIALQLEGGNFVPHGYPDPEQITGWCHGYFLGLAQDPQWRHPDSVGAARGIILLAPDMAGVRFKTTGPDGAPVDDPATVATMMRAELADLVIAVFEDWREHREQGGLRCSICGESDDPQARMPSVRPWHFGRNEPCPCGSGRKYKRCCLQHEPGLAHRH